MGSNEELRKTVQLDGGLEWGSTAAQPPEVKVVDFRATLPGIPELVVRFQGNQGSAELHIGHRCQLLRLTGKAPDRVTISGGAKGSVTLLEMVDLSARSNPSVHLSVGGQLEVESATALRSKVKVNLHVPSLVVQDSEVELVSVDGPTPPQVGVDGKSVLSGHSTASVFVNPCSKVECSATLRGEMLLAAESTVVLADGASLGTLKAAPGSAYPRVIASAVGNSNVGRSVRVLENVRLSSEGLGHVHVAERIEGVELEVPGPVKVELGHGAVMRSVSGRVNLGSAPNATVQAFGAAPLVLDDLGGSACPGARIYGVKIDPPLSSRGLLDRLRVSEMDVFEPALDDLVKWVDDGTIDLKNVDHRQWTHDLARLVRRTTGSGSLRTATSWASHRAHQYECTGRLEKALVLAHRSMGFGQRARQPASAWVLSMIAVACTYLAFSGDYSLDMCDRSAWATFGRLVAETLFLPTGWVGIAGQSTNTALQIEGVWLKLARLVVSVPFAFLVTALVRLAGDPLRSR